MRKPLSAAVRHRLPFALRAGLCCGLPVVLGYYAGHLQAGLLATIGGFTALYGDGLPWGRRARLLAIIAVALAVIVTLGILVAPYPWLGVVTVTGIASLATLICNRQQIGPPGAYMFALACASGTGMPGSSIDPWFSGLWVLCGGAISWLAHMLGCLSERAEANNSPVADKEIKENARRTAARVAFGTLVAGSIGIILGLEHAYWGMAAVVVVLNQPDGLPGTSRRAFNRLLGTLVGLVLAWSILTLNPQGLWIALTVGVLQFAIEIGVVLQYAVATVFITANALTIAAGGRDFSEVSPLFAARAFDTLIGVLVAIVVFRLSMAPTVDTPS